MLLKTLRKSLLEMPQPEGLALVISKRAARRTNRPREVEKPKARRTSSRLAKAMELVKSMPKEKIKLLLEEMQKNE